jgi:hypothetical protein
MPSPNLSLSLSVHEHEESYLEKTACLDIQHLQFPGFDSRFFFRFAASVVHSPSHRLPGSSSPAMSAPQQNEAEKNIEIWKVKKLIKRLEAARGNGTSMISLIIRKSMKFLQIHSV